MSTKYVCENQDGVLGLMLAQARLYSEHLVGGKTEEIIHTSNFWNPCTVSIKDDVPEINPNHFSQSFQFSQVAAGIRRRKPQLNPCY